LIVNLGRRIRDPKMVDVGQRMVGAMTNLHHGGFQESKSPAYISEGTTMVMMIPIKWYQTNWVHLSRGFPELYTTPGPFWELAEKVQGHSRLHCRTTPSDDVVSTMWKQAVPAQSSNVLRVSKGRLVLALVSFVSHSKK